MLDRDASAAVNECPAVAAAPSRGMAPSPENDSAPKAPDKPRHDKCLSAKEKNKDDKTLSDLNDGELKGLLDEALNYKNPKDREGKSKLFNHLLNEAEEDERNARAARAGGSELVRYCNPSAKRNSRHRKKPSSISENMMHGGSLDNLAKEELFETSKHRTKKSVSARQREGGSLPCNVNASTIISHDYQFLEEARKKKEMTEKISTDVVEEQRLLEHDTLDQNFQEKVNEIPQLKFTTRASLQVNHGDIDRNRTVEKKGLQPRVPVFHVFMSRGGPDNEVDGPIQFPHLEQAVERKTCATTKSVNPIIGPDCSGTFRISNDAKKVDENGNALHQSSVKTKKKKVLTDKNVVVCSAENVEGHRSDIISDIDKLMEFIGISDDQSEKSRPIKSKQLNRHSSDDTSKSKKRAHSSKSKDSRSKLQKSNSLGEISTTNLEDFEFDKDKAAMRNGKGGPERPRERRSWGNVEPPPLQNLYGNASAENLESAEFRVVTKKKKSKRRRSSIGGRTKASTAPAGKAGARGPSPDVARRKSACSVPHSEKSNDSSDVDSVHSLPIDPQRLNMPISYADMAKTNERPKGERKQQPPPPPTNDDKVPKEAAATTGDVAVVVSKSVSSPQIASDHVARANSADTSPSSVKSSTPPDVHNIRNFPAIGKQAANVAEKAKTSNKISRSANANRNVKSNANKTACAGAETQNDVPNDHVIPAVHEIPDMGYSSSLPPDIPDVQTIEKMQLMGQGHPTTTNCYDDSPTTTSPLNNGNDCSVDCDNLSDNNSRTSGADAVADAAADEEEPPVVIMNCFANKEVSDLTFGFEVNEQLLTEDLNREISCADFIARYVAPEAYTTTSHNHDKIVGYVGAAWEDAAGNVPTGKVQYYTDAQ